MAVRSRLCGELLRRLCLGPFTVSTSQETAHYSTTKWSRWWSSSFLSASKQPPGLAYSSELVRVPLGRRCWPNRSVEWWSNGISTGSMWACRVPSAYSGSGNLNHRLEESNLLQPKLRVHRAPRADIVCGLGGGVERTNLESTNTWTVRQCSTKASSSGYRESTVRKSTRNMPLTPKKWKRTLPSKEVVNVVHSLRRVKRTPDAIKEVLRKYVARLLKLEMMLVLSELQRLDEWHLARQVFNMIRKESWYRPDVYLFQTMVQVFGRNKQIKEVEKMFEELEDEGLQPDDSIKRELLRSYVISGMMAEAITLYKEILKMGKDQAARSILFHGLRDEDREELALYERREGIDWSFVEKRD